MATVDIVVNFDMPLNALIYLHRAGRTGRLGWERTMRTPLEAAKRRVRMFSGRSDGEVDAIGGQQTAERPAEIDRSQYAHGRDLCTQRSQSQP